jgi:peroxiredoxin
LLIGQELFGEKKGIIFAVPGAFTPGCSRAHLPGYIDNWEKLREKGVELVACVSVNDPFVMAAWGKAAGADGKVRMLADPNAGILFVQLDLTYKNLQKPSVWKFPFRLLVGSGANDIPCLWKEEK